MHSLLLLINADLSALAATDQPVDQFFARLDMPGFDEYAVYNLKLALQELCANIVNHAYAGESGSIFLRISVDEDAQSVEIATHDRGRNRCDLAGWRPPQLDAPQEHGMGLWLMHELMDEVCYKIHDDGVNCWRLRKGLTF